MSFLLETGRELRLTLRLAAPIIAGQVSGMILGLTDTLMIGKVGVVPLAAAAFANILFHIVFVFGIGLLTSVSVMVSHAHGASDHRATAEILRQGMFLAVVGGLLLAGLQIACIGLFPWMGQSPDVIDAAIPYFIILALSIPLQLATIAIKNYTEAQSSPWPAFWVGMGSVVLNVFLNWLLIFGNWGFPEMGLFGAGVATWISRLAGLVGLILWVRKDARFIPSWPGVWLKRIDWPRVWQMLRIGFPVGLQILLEVGAFAAAAILMGMLGVNELAAHQIAITCAATTFMFPLGLSMAVTIRMGQALGGGDIRALRTISYGSLGLIVCSASLFALGYILLREPIAGAFTQDAIVLPMAAGLLLIAGLFQLMDGVQCVAMGALRGLKDVDIPTRIVFAAFWLFSLPFGAWLAFWGGWGAKGIWLGLLLGLSFAAVGLIARLVRQVQKFAD